MPANIVELSYPVNTRDLQAEMGGIYESLGSDVRRSKTSGSLVGVDKKPGSFVLQNKFH